MADIRPFPAIRYSESDISALIAPPYDILSEEDKQALLGRSPSNIVKIDLPHVPPKTAGPDEVYQQADEELRRWLEQGILKRDAAPAVYAYHQTYRLKDRSLTRKMFFARLRLEEFGQGKVYPHEQTFGGPKEDRLKLTFNTRCNLSPIFGLYVDSDLAISRRIDQALDRPADQSGVLDGVENRLWALTDPALIEDLQGRLAGQPIFIADGHHRYSTALNYQRFFIDTQGELPPDAAVNFVLTVFCAMEDPGAVIRPYFRSIADVPNLTLNELQAALAEAFFCEVVATPADADELAALLARTDPSAMALYFAREDRTLLIRPLQDDLLEKFEPQRSPAWRTLAYSILHRYLIDEILVRRFNMNKPPVIHYHKAYDEALAGARLHQGVAALMPATTLEQLRAICTAGELMPQKSTYFHPKLATGMVINPLE